MSQEGKAGKNLLQVGRDYITTIQFSILSGTFSLTAQLFKYISKYIKSFFEKDKIIRKLEHEIDEKTHTIETLQRSLNQHLEKLYEAQTKMQPVVDAALNICKKASEKGIYDESLKTLCQLSMHLDSFNRQNEQRKPYINAALWITPRIEAWAEEATEVVAEEYSTDINSTKKDSFYSDILKYLNWLQESMLYAKPLRKTLVKLNDSRNILQPHPYRTTFKYLKSKVTTKDMPLEEVYALHKMIDFLIDNF
jgi:hypothetical protein